MKLYAALLTLSLLMAAPAESQTTITMDQRLDEMESMAPHLDTKLILLINDVYIANWQAVDFHNDNISPLIRGYIDINSTWSMMHRSLVARWTAWDEDYQYWFTKKKTEASASIAVSGGVQKVRDVKTMEVQNHTMLLWRSVLMQVGYLNDNKELVCDLGDMDDLWSEFLARLDKLDKAINALRRY